MTSDYPLYDYLYSNVDQVVDPSVIASTIKSIHNLSTSDAKLHYDELNSLIYYHYYKENGNLPSDVGKRNSIYGSSIMAGGKGVVYTIKNFPIHLQIVLQNYCKAITSE